MKVSLKNKIYRMDRTQLYQKIYMDPITGCLNRNAFNDCEPRDVIAIIDMDSLKWINDNIGHLTGDKALNNFANMLIRAFSINDCYRLSGDEFAVTGHDYSYMLIKICRLQEASGMFSFGIATDLNNADHFLIENKKTREMAGLRAPRGEKPVWYK